MVINGLLLFGVSTHSRPKAAGGLSYIQAARVACFNSQPPEGGWPEWLAF